MADQNINSNPKHQSEENNTLENKRYKLDPDVETTEAKELIDNIDCLEEIFMRKSLSPMDLLNLAISDSRLKQAAERVYKNKFGKCLVEIRCKNKSVELLKALDGSIEWKYCLTFLRHFGHLISRMEICYAGYHGWKSRVSFNFVTRLDHYINEYCTESLSEITFEESSHEMMKDLKKPFMKVESVDFHKCILGGELSEVNKWFPNVRDLTFSGTNQLVNRHGLVVQFLHLQSLNVSVCHDERNYINEKIVVETLRLNPQLQKLSIGGYFDNIWFLQSCSAFLQNLECLDIYGSKFSNINGENMHFQNVKKLKISSENNYPRLPLSFDKLEEFTYYAGAFDDVLLEFINKQKLLKKLSYTGPCKEEGVLLKIALPSLTEIYLTNCQFSIDVLTAFVNRCKLLKKMTLTFKTLKECNSFGTEWRKTNRTLETFFGFLITLER